jgi:hypothetical protein
MDPFRDEAAITTNSVVLEKLKVAARAQLSAQVMRDLRVETYMEPMLNRMVIQLASHVYAHEHARNDIVVPFEKTAAAHVPAPRRFLWLFAPIVLAGLVLAAATASWPAVVLSMLVATATVVIHAANPPQSATATARGDVTVTARDLYKFPDNTMVYPGHLGGPVEYVQTEPPDVHYRD